jgi:UDP-N-acetylmuramate dehydrogenase
VEILENVLLAPYTSLGVGGPARWLVNAGEPTEILAGVQFARQHNVPFFILGGGSNLLVSDQGFAGVVIRTAGLTRMQIVRQQGVVCIQADAGVDWDAVVRLAITNNCAGIECLAGIPGTVGGSPVQNIGAYGQEVSTSIILVHALDLQTEKFVRLYPDDCGFSYRRSIFNSTHQGRYAITRVEFMLKLGRPATLEYDDLKRHFAALEIAEPSLFEVSEAVRAIRHRKGMLLSDDDPNSRSAGSFFKNPVVSEALLARAADGLTLAQAEIPHWPAGEGAVKLSAAWLIERAGFARGYSMGQAGISAKHTLALVNLGRATSAEIIALRDAIRDAVQERFAIYLEQEPVSLGFAADSTAGAAACALRPGPAPRGPARAPAPPQS